MQCTAVTGHMWGQCKVTRYWPSSLLCAYGLRESQVLINMQIKSASNLFHVLTYNWLKWFQPSLNQNFRVQSINTTKTCTQEKPKLNILHHVITWLTIKSQCQLSGFLWILHKEWEWGQYPAILTEQLGLKDRYLKNREHNLIFWHTVSNQEWAS